MNKDTIRSHIFLIEDNKTDILDNWLDFQDVISILTKYNVSIPVFKEKFASGIFDYFIDILDQKAKIGDCPVMGTFFDILKNKGVAPHELFMICTHFKRSLINFCFEKNIITQNINDQINFILDKNLEGVLERYAQLIKTKNELINEQQSSLLQYMDAIDKGTIFSKADPKGIITYVNDKFCEISEYTQEELIGKPHNLVRHPDEPKEIFKNMWRKLRKLEHWNGLLKNRSKNGKEYYVNTLIVPITNSKNELVEYISIRQDLTESIELFHELESSQKEIIYKMGEVCETRSNETGNHVKRVANYSKLLATLYGLEQEKIDILYTASPMHDIGKVGIADSILNKPGKLTSEEYDIMKNHATIGYEI